MGSRLLKTERIVSFIGFIFLLAAFICTLFLNGDKNSIINIFIDSKILWIVVHSICAILCLFTFFKPNFRLFSIILFIESNTTILTNFEHLGIFFFYGMIALELISGYLKNKGKYLIIIQFIIHLICIILIYPHGLPRVIIALCTSFFYLTFFTWLYQLVKIKFSCLIPASITLNSVLKNKQVGSTISLSKYGLTERQINLTLDYINLKLSYKDLSEKYNMSVSTVKKDFSEIFKIFGVTKIEDLLILLLQYQITK